MPCFDADIAVDWQMESLLEDKRTLQVSLDQRKGQLGGIREQFKEAMVRLLYDAPSQSPALPPFRHISPESI